jgi:hypothetical protein
MDDGWTLLPWAMQHTFVKKRTIAIMVYDRRPFLPRTMVRPVLYILDRAIWPDHGRAFLPRPMELALLVPKLLELYLWGCRYYFFL